MRSVKSVFFVFIAAVLIALGNSAVFGKVVTLGDSGWIVGSDDNVTFETVDETPDNVTVNITKYFTGSPNDFDIISPILIELIKYGDNPAPVIIVNETVYNNTTVGWTDYHIELGWPTTCGFDNSTVPVSSAFSHSEFSNYLGLGVVDGLPLAITYDNGFVPVGGSVTFTNLILHMDATSTETDIFYLKQWPSVPEPLTISVLLLGLGLIRRNK
jgi:hypothetical protein